MNFYFKKIQGFGQIFEIRKQNVLSIILYVKKNADSKQVTKINQMCIIFGPQAKKRILKKNMKIFTLASIKTIFFEIF